MQYPEIEKIVHESLRGLKLDPESCKGEKSGQWNLKIKDSTVWIDVFNFEGNPERWYVQVMSPLLKVPEKNHEAFAINCLEINHKLYGCSICKKGDWYYVISLREAEGLDLSEMDAMVDRVGIYSSDYYGKLTFKFEGSWPPAPPAGSGEAPKD